MRSISLFALGLAGSATAFVLPAPLPLAKRASVLRMNDPPAPPPPAPAPVAAPAPAPAALDEKAAAEKAFQEMKEKGNAKRARLQGITQTIIPGAAILGLAAVQFLGGRDSLKELEANMPNPFDNTPGMAEAKKLTAEQQARKQDKIDALRGIVDSSIEGISDASAAAD